LSPPNFYKSKFRYLLKASSFLVLIKIRLKIGLDTIDRRLIKASGVLLSHKFKGLIIDLTLILVYGQK